MEDGICFYVFLDGPRVNILLSTGSSLLNVEPISQQLSVGSYSVQLGVDLKMNILTIRQQCEYITITQRSGDLFLHVVWITACLSN